MDAGVSRCKKLLRTLRILWLLVPSYGIGFLLLTPKAYWQRIREGRSLFSPIFPQRGRNLPAASLKGRELSKEPYLRPTAYCQCHAPEILELADSIRKRCKSDWEYAQAIYDFVRNEIAFAHEPPPRNGVVGSLRSGCGICIDKLNLLIALARAGNIPARYCTIGNTCLLEPRKGFPRVQLFSLYFAELKAKKDKRLMRIIVKGMQRMLKQREFSISSSCGSIKTDGMAELKINDYWIMADPTWDDGEAAALDLPLPRLGYDPLTMRGLIGSTVNRSEDLPLDASFFMVRHILCFCARGTHDYLNLALEKAREHGRKILDEIGRDEYIRRKKRFYIPFPNLEYVKQTHNNSGNNES